MIEWSLVGVVVVEIDNRGLYAAGEHSLSRCPGSIDNKCEPANSIAISVAENGGDCHR